MSDDLVAGRYRLGRGLGSGGMGRVWHARDEVLRRSVAVKEVLLPEGLAEDEATELRMRTLREARAAARLSHPNVVRVYDVIYADGRPWIVMEYIPSRSLAHVISEHGPVSPGAAAKVGLAVLDALVAAHQAGVLHRDVKPGNVLLGANGRVVLTDFGLAVYDDLGLSLTKSGVIHGSPQFIAPERALDGTSTVESDMWSLGATLYAAVEGRSPYSRPSSYATLAALATAPPDPPHRAGELKPVLAGLLRRNPRARMKPEEVRARLQRVAAPDAGRTRAGRGRRQPESPSGNIAEPRLEPVGSFEPDGGSHPADDTSGPLGTEPPEVGTGAAQAVPAEPITPEWTPTPISPAAPAAGAFRTPTGERRTVTPLPRRNPGAFTGAAAPARPPQQQSPTRPPAGAAPRAGSLDDSGVGLIDLVEGLERDEVTPMMPYPPPGIRKRRTRWPRRHRGRSLLIGALALVLLVSAALAVREAMSGSGDSSAGAARSGSPSSSPPATPVALAFPCAYDRPATLSSVPAGPRVIGRFGVNPGYTWYVSPGPAPAKIGVPQSWGMVASGSVACFYEQPTGPEVLGVTTVPTKISDPRELLTSWQDELLASADSPIGYQGKIATSVYTPTQGVWDYTYLDGGVLMHVEVTAKIPAKGQAYAFSFEDTEFNWPNDTAIINQCQGTFGPMES